MKKHINVPIFIPHLGCPNDCVFCNQRKISGKANFEKQAVRRELEEAFSTVDGTVSAQIAYFGGSFTGIERNEMLELLEIANEYIESGKCDSVRISTRPDYINREILEILRAYRVNTVELGIQSTDEAVLSACRRGHTKEDSFRAAALIKEYGMEFVGQMMVGLPLGTEENERKTAEDICRMGADGARIYPTVVFGETALAGLWKKGAYQPLTEETSVLRAANALSVFIGHDVPVIRIGLQSGEGPQKGIAGGYHPAVGELAYARCFRLSMEKALENRETAGKCAVVRAHPSDVSKVIGQRAENRIYFTEKYLLTGFRVLPDAFAVKNHPSITLQ
ncbi:MAG: radical SAM protein [Ruminococcaceae bacterium]|nr:radical SAM protein [Oscillospiraceae bacterium]